MWLVTANCQELEIFAVRVRGFGGVPIIFIVWLAAS